MNAEVKCDLIQILLSLCHTQSNMCTQRNTQQIHSEGLHTLQLLFPPSLPSVVLGLSAIKKNSLAFCCTVLYGKAYYSTDTSLMSPG